MDLKSFDTEYSKLNKAQKEAVDSIEGPVMVVAGPGTGKTQILTLRIANILQKTDISPENILALTFTNSGVYSMRKRLSEIIGDSAYRVGIFTFHAFCEQLIKEFPLYFEDFENSKVIDDLEKIKILEDILSDGSYEKLKTFNDDHFFLNSIRKAVDSIKSEGITPDDFLKSLPEWKDNMLSSEDIYYKKKFRQFNVGDIKPSEKEKIEYKIKKAEEVADVYMKYQQKIKEINRYDFSDMIISVLRKLKEDESFKYDVQEKYQYILVDEHQDTNEGQNELIELLTDAPHLNNRPNIFTVGDEKQSIYRFQGASEKTFSHFENIYEDVKKISLEENYRSTQNILSGAHGVIEYTIKDSIDLRSNSEDNSLIQIGGFSNYKMELMYVANDIKEKISVGIDPSEIAIIFRANKNTEDIKSVLAHKKIPFTVHSRDSVFEDIDISNITTILRVISDPYDEKSLAESLFINFVGINSFDIYKVLNSRKIVGNKPLFEIISSRELLDKIGINKSGEFIAYADLIAEAIKDSKNNTFTNFFKIFLDKIGYISYALNSELSQQKLLKIDKFIDELKKQNISRGRDFNLSECLKMIDAYHKYGIDIENADPEIESGVQLMTAHGSKGKEFECVYIVNSVRSAWEKNRGIGGIAIPIESYAGGEHDERRLFYVAMTRAKNKLTITYSETDWEGKEQEKSQFINEIPSNYIEEVKSTGIESEYLKDIQIFIEPHNVRYSVYDPSFIKKTYLESGLNLTALNNYLECPLKYFYRNLIRIPTPYVPAMIYGTAIHDSLEKFFIKSKEKEKIQDKKYLLELFEKAIASVDLNIEDLPKYKERGIESLSKYYEEYKDSWIYNVLTEQNITKEYKIDNKEKILLKGKLDKIEYLNNELDGPIKIVDYKTGKAYSEKDKGSKEDLDRQIAFYYLLLEGYKDDKNRVDNAELDFIEVNKKGDFEKYTISRDAAKLDELRETINKVSEEILSGEIIDKGCMKKDCEWCSLHQKIHQK